MRPVEAIAGRKPSVIPAFLCVAATYVYFLLFAEFGFVEQVRVVVGSEERLHQVLGVLGTSGILGGLAAAFLVGRLGTPRVLGYAFLGCLLGAFLSAGASPGELYLCSALVGLSLGSATVSLSSGLMRASHGGSLAWVCALGTGFAYAFCNMPGIFDASPVHQAFISCGFAAVGLASAPFLDTSAPGGDRALTLGTSQRWLLGASFLGLVGLDSSGFFIVQHTAPLKAATWGTGMLLLRNAATHAIGALGAGWLLSLRRTGWALLAATVCLVGADLLIARGAPETFTAAAGLYTLGVSLYSVSLVYVASSQASPGFSALLFGLAGWAGSALGIGFAGQLRAIPPEWAIGVAVPVAVCLVGARLGGWARTAGVLVFAFLMASVPRALASGDGIVEIGREVYIAEGCMACHSQYVRPSVASDVLWWGPAASLQERLEELPPLFGLRRQGPDLTNVGNRRSAEWERLHLKNPQAVAEGSRMPRYDRLFKPGDGRGEALVAYLCSLGAQTVPERLESIARWRPSTDAVRLSHSPQATERLYSRLCAGCHGAQGKGDGPLAASLGTTPPDFSGTGWRHQPEAGESQRVSVARIIKFGIIGTPMAGHEYLDDQEVLGLADYVVGLHTHL